MTRRQPRRLGNARAGFTMMEALISLLLLLLSILGMGALAGSAVRTNLDAQKRTEATYLAERMLSLIRIEAQGWNDATWNLAVDSPDVDQYMPLLNHLEASATEHEEGFRELTQDILPDGIQAFDKNLAMVLPGNAQAQYCVHYKLTWLQPNESIRAEVRVYWLRRFADNAVIGEFAGSCGAAVAANWEKNVTDLSAVSDFDFIARNGGAR